MRISAVLILIIALAIGAGCSNTNSAKLVRSTESFNYNWKFMLGDPGDAFSPTFDDSAWRELNLPHDWSIEGMFSEEHPSTPGGGALPGGVGWYRKSFKLPEGSMGKKISIEFDGVYQESEVWINGQYLGLRPNGYISFSYDLTPHLHGDGSPNLLAVKVDNSRQPNSRWYSGSGIYREVRLVVTEALHVDQWGTFISTPNVNEKEATVSVQTSVRNEMDQEATALLTSIVLDPDGRKLFVS